MYNTNTIVAIAAALLSGSRVGSFAPKARRSPARSGCAPHLGVTNGAQPDAPQTLEQDQQLQWNLFTDNHAVDGEWWGTWQTFNYMGDLEDSTVAAVSLQLDSADSNEVTQTHRILTSSTQSDCKTCFSSSEVATIPVATYTPETLGRRHRCAARGMAIGPSLLKSGAMSTELVLRHGDGRVRVVFQHAPVWERDVEPGSCPPQGLKLFRAMISREKLRDVVPESTESEIQGPPSAEEEKENPPVPGNPRFFRPVPPFNWHKKWSGTSWTWGQQTGDRGWSIEEMDEADSWHGRPSGDVDGTWHLRQGSVLIQCPKIIIGGVAGICRLAWLAEDDGEEGTNTDGNTAKLLRIEASVSALEPIISDDDEDMMVGFYPPTLGSLRTDIMEKIGELEGESLLEREARADGYVGITSPEETASVAASVEKKTGLSDDEKEKIQQDPRNALDF